jgi:hypothetical protein
MKEGTTVLHVAVDDQVLIRAAMFPEEAHAMPKLVRSDVGDPPFLAYMTAEIIARATEGLEAACMRANVSSDSPQAALSLIAQLSLVVPPPEIPDSVKSQFSARPEDAEVCQLATEYSCHLIITESRHLMPVGFWEGIPLGAEADLAALVDLGVDELGAGPETLDSAILAADKELGDLAEEEHIHLLPRRGRAYLPSDTRPAYKAIQLRLSVLQLERERLSNR